MNNYFNNIILYFLTILILHLLIKIYLLEDNGVNFIDAREYYNTNIGDDTTYNEDNTSHYNENTSHYNENTSNTINDYAKDAKDELLTYLDNEKKNKDEEIHTLLTKSTTINKNTIDNSFNNLNKDIYTFDEVPTQNLQKRDVINANDINANNINANDINANNINANYINANNKNNTIIGYDDFENSYFTL